LNSLHQKVSTNPDEIVIEASVVVAAPVIAVYKTAWLLLFDAALAFAHPNLCLASR
jgi:hypothetical protein